ncbi:MAG: BON domain-containing protein [Pirellulales bacterium]|nr:BON domain-containing protein [Pirellulales bacterium]
MRMMLRTVAAAVLAALLPTLAWANDQETAQQIADDLRASGRLQNYSIGVKYKDGTAWLSGRVANKQQMSDALRMAKQSPSVGRVVNQLQVGNGEESAASGQMVRQAGPAGNQHSRVRQASTQWGDDGGYEAMPMQQNMPRQPMPNQRAVAMQRSNKPYGTPIPGMQGRPMQASYNGADCPPGMMNGGEMSGGMPAMMGAGGGPLPAYVPGTGGGPSPAIYDQPNMPNYAWPAYSAYPNYAALAYPKQYSATAWPFIGPFYPYPQVPLGWRKVSLEWDDGWWFLDFHDTHR